MDPYDCICEYILSMRRLLSWLSTQNHCTDTICFTEHPGYQGGGEEMEGPGMMTIVLFLLLWVLIALLLFFFRPRSLRSSGNDKPAPSSLHNDDRQLPPPTS